MEYDPKDNEVISLLKKLKESNGAYPPEMLTLRRQGYLRQVAEISGGAGLSMGLRNAIKGGKAASLPPAAGTVIEALLIIALVAEAGAVTYFYRDRIAQVFRSVTSTPIVQEVANPIQPILPSPIPENETATPSPVSTVTETLTPVGSPTLELAADPTEENSGNSVNGVSGVTSDPGSNGSTQTVATQSPEDNDDNGNHYGLTPKPVRTKEPGNSVSATQESNTNPKKKP